MPSAKAGNPNKKAYMAAKYNAVYRAIPINKCKRALVASRIDARRRGCKPCSASPEELLGKLTSVCHICSRETPQSELSMDHCHSMGFFRGWLCDNCNHGLGKFRDSPDLLRIAADYLEKVYEN